MYMRARARIVHDDERVYARGLIQRGCEISPCIVANPILGLATYFKICYLPRRARPRGPMLGLHVEYDDGKRNLWLL